MGRLQSDLAPACAGRERNDLEESRQCRSFDMLRAEVGRIQFAENFLNSQTLVGHMSLKPEGLGFQMTYLADTATCCNPFCRCGV